MKLQFAMLVWSVVLAGCAAKQGPPWRGVDLSYVNELEVCGARYLDDSGATDPYRILAKAGANIVRLRLWHQPDWTNYSTLPDVKRSIRRARQENMRVLLDFHYSDDWAHPGKQLPPADWVVDLASPEQLARRLRSYTVAVLLELHADGLLPEAVQVGNEINTNLLWPEEVAEDAPIDWQRNAPLVNAALAAVREVSVRTGRPIELMLHIAQPENVESWLAAAARHGVNDFDLIGVSYYAKWSTTPMAAIESFIRRLRAQYAKDVVIVETAYAWTQDGVDQASNLLGSDSLIESYPATPAGQRRYLADLMSMTRRAGGLGIVYWEPAWISSDCSTRWGQGSHWENAALFDFDGRLLPGAYYLSQPDPANQ